VSAGLFTAFDLLYEPGLRDDEYYVLSDLIDWFNVHMKGPVYYRLKEPGVHREQSAGSSQQRTNTCHVRGRWSGSWKEMMSSFGRSRSNDPVTSFTKTTHRFLQNPLPTSDRFFREVTRNGKQDSI